MYSVFGDRFTAQYFQQEIVERAQRFDQHSSPFYYIAENLRTYWPWMIALAYAIFLRVRRPRDPRHDFVTLATVWVVLVLIALSAFADRKPNYALPLYPMLSWIAAWGLCQIPFAPLREWFDRGFPWLISATAALFLIVAIAPIEFQRPPEKNWIALIEWIKANHIDAAQMEYRNIDQNDVSYVYLKTGK